MESYWKLIDFQNSLQTLNNNRKFRYLTRQYSKNIVQMCIMRIKNSFKMNERTLYVCGNLNYNCDNGAPQTGFLKYDLISLCNGVNNVNIVTLFF